MGQLDDALSYRQSLLWIELHLIRKTFELKQIFHRLSHVVKICLALGLYRIIIFWISPCNGHHHHVPLRSVIFVFEERALMNVELFYFKIRSHLPCALHKKYSWRLHTAPRYAPFYNERDNIWQFFGLPGMATAQHTTNEQLSLWSAVPTKLWLGVQFSLVGFVLWKIERKPKSFGLVFSKP